MWPVARSAGLPRHPARYAAGEHLPARRSASPRSSRFSARTNNLHDDVEAPVHVLYSGSSFSIRLYLARPRSAGSCPVHNRHDPVPCRNTAQHRPHWRSQRGRSTIGPASRTHTQCRTKRHSRQSHPKANRTRTRHVFARDLRHARQKCKNFTMYPRTFQHSSH